MTVDVSIGEEVAQTTSLSGACKTKVNKLLDGWMAIISRKSFINVKLDKALMTPDCTRLLTSNR